MFDIIMSSYVNFTFVSSYPGWRDWLSTAHPRKDLQETSDAANQISAGTSPHCWAESKGIQVHNTIVDFFTVPPPPKIVMMFTLPSLFLDCALPLHHII